MEPVSEQTLKAWYNHHYAAHGRKAMRPKEAYAIFIDLLKVSKGKKLLDIGCGTGFLLSAATARGLNTTGMDISDEAVKIAQLESPGSQIEVHTAEDLGFEEKKFDYITCLGSLEHFLDIDKSLQEMKRVTKEDAKFCIMVPNSGYLFWKISGKCGTQQQAINERLMSLEAWTATFVRNGFDILEIHPDPWYAKMKLFSSLNPLGILKRIVYRIVWRFIPLRWTYQFVFILKKHR